MATASVNANTPTNVHQTPGGVKESEGKEKRPLGPLQIPGESHRKGLTKHERVKEGGGGGGEAGLLGESVWRAEPAIGRHLLSRREAGEERGVANEYCGLAAETALGLFIERQPASP